MLLEMLLLNEPEEVLCHSFSYAWAQGHIVGICLAAIIVFFQLLLRFCGVLCSSAYGLALIVCLFIVAPVIFGVLCSITGACGVLCSITSSIASIS
jgi:hypothetical protein